MRHLIFLFTIVLFLFACNQNNSVTKENEVSVNDSSNTNPSNTLKSDTNTDKTSPVALTITPLDTEGDMGQVTFTQDKKTIFYYDLKSNKGKVNLSGKEYILDKYDFNSDTYKLSGKQVTITAPKAKYSKNDGTDCNYGKFTEVLITLGSDQLTLKNIEVQDCPNY